MFYGKHVFPNEYDINGNLYILDRDTDHMTRSKVLHYPSILYNKRNVTRTANKS